MKIAVTLIAAAIVGGGVAFIVPSFAEDAHIGVGPVGSDHDGYYRDHHTTIIKREEPREHTTIIKKERRLRPDKKVIIHDDD